MTESVKQRLSGSHIGKMNDLELRKLFLAIQSDLAANLADRNNLQIIVNNLGDAVLNLQASVNNLVSDVTKISNNTNSANNTVQILGKVITANINAVTLLGTLNTTT
jgi:cytolysin (calcineurin-like family phosphatase)